MNILPKKRWHVRTKDNIARVRKDEAAALEKQKICEAKAKQAESEARINFLRQKSGLPPTAFEQSGSATTNDAKIVAATGHVDLFSDFKSHVKTTNSELEKEKKEEKEKYEKQIGYLTYLGQDTNEALKLRSWYEVAPKRSKVDDDDDVEVDTRKIEKDLKAKYIQDPLTLINALLPPEKKSQTTTKANAKPMVKAIEPFNKITAAVSKETDDSFSLKVKKHKKHKKLKKKDRKKEKYHKREKEPIIKKQTKNLDNINQRNKIEELRKARLQREAVERARQEALLATQGKVEEIKTKLPPTPRIIRKYNSQFNPELAKQNMQ